MVQKKFIPSAKDNETQYNKAMDEVLNLHHDRTEKYGSNWTNIGPEGNFWLLKSKFLRFEDNFRLNDNNYESAIDNLRDLINYAVFQIVMIKREKRAGKK